MMKFILFKHRHSGEQVPVVFPALVKHSEFAFGMSESYVPIAAGFVHVNHEGKLEPSGYSMSLNLSATDEAVTAFEMLNSEMY